MLYFHAFPALMTLFLVPVLKINLYGLAFLTALRLHFSCSFVPAKGSSLERFPALT